MATFRQKKTAQAIVDNAAAESPKNAKDLLVSVGYSEKVATHKPGEIINSKGVVEELELLGFSEANAKKVVGEILLNDNVEEKDRLKAAELVFKVHGSFAPIKTANLHAVVEQTDGDIDLDEIVKEVESKLKELKTNGEQQTS